MRSFCCLQKPMFGRMCSDVSLHCVNNTFTITEKTHQFFIKHQYSNFMIEDVCINDC